jgi:hypothetical protein
VTWWLAATANVVVSVVVVLVYWWLSRPKRVPPADPRPTIKAANEASIDAEKARATVAQRPYNRVCEQCGASFGRNPLIVSMHCDACIAKALDKMIEQDRDDWAKADGIIKRADGTEVVGKSEGLLILPGWGKDKQS